MSIFLFCKFKILFFKIKTYFTKKTVPFGGQEFKFRTKVLENVAQLNSNVMRERYNVERFINFQLKYLTKCILL